MDDDMRDRDLDGPWADPALGALFTQLREAGERPAPPMRADLAGLLAGVAPLEQARSRRSRMGRAGITGLVTAGFVASGLGAAAANELPPPAQRVVSTVVNKLTPFKLPKPDSQSPAEREVDGDQPGHSGSTPREQSSPDDDRTDEDVDAPTAQPTTRDDDQADDDQADDDRADDREAPSPGSPGSDSGGGQDETDREASEPDSDESQGGSDSDEGAEPGDAERSGDSDDSDHSGGSGDEDRSATSGDEHDSEPQSGD